MALDTIRALETPEGIELQLQVAGPAIRAAAWLLDGLIRLLIYALALALPLRFGNMGWGMLLLLYFLITWFYPVLFEVFKGATPGKKRFNLCVCHDNGTPIGWQASMIRNLLRAADFLPFFYGFGLVAMLLNRDFKRLGDLAAGTLVIYRNREAPDYQIPALRPLPLPLALGPSEQRAILEFAERERRLSPARQIELADILKDLTRQGGDKGREQLLRYANWIQRGGEEP